jgi:hypothetical protein
MRRRLFVAVQILFAIAVLWWGGGTIVEQWNDARSQALGANVDWTLVVASTIPVLVAYALLIQAWRSMVTEWGAHLSYTDAARIWFVSNLGRYIPGKIWQISAMGVLAERAGVSPLVATSSAILVNLVNLVAGAALVAATGAGLLGNPVAVGAGAAAMGAVLVFIPMLLPSLARLVARTFGRRLELPRLTPRPVWMAAAVCMAAWALYGIAFRIFAEGIAPEATGGVTAYVAAFTASYLIGYVMLFAPGGIVFREAALGAFLARLDLVSGGTGALIAVTSRLWLTVLEVLPGLLYLAIRVRPPASRASTTE